MPRLLLYSISALWVIYVYTFSPFLGRPYFAAFHSFCGFQKALGSLEGVKNTLALKAHMKKESRVLETSGPNQLWQTPRGQFWIVGNGPEIPDNIALVLAEQQALIYGAVRSGDIVLDCGADVGTFTRSALNSGAAKVVSIEPSPEKGVCMRKTFAAEIIAGKVMVVSKGVWKESGELKLYGDSIVDKRTSDGPIVPLVTIDSLVAELQLPRVDFIKMDIEGAEKQALAGARNTLQRFKPRLAIATEHLPDDVVKIPETIKGIVPDYSTACGPCEFEAGRFRPQVLYFNR